MVDQSVIFVVIYFLNKLIPNFLARHRQYNLWNSCSGIPIQVYEPVACRSTWLSWRFKNLVIKSSWTIGTSHFYCALSAIMTSSTEFNFTFVDINPWFITQINLQPDVGVNSKVFFFGFRFAWLPRTTWKVPFEVFEVMVIFSFPNSTTVSHHLVDL